MNDSLSPAARAKQSRKRTLIITSFTILVAITLGLIAGAYSMHIHNLTTSSTAEQDQTESIPLVHIVKPPTSQQLEEIGVTELTQDLTTNDTIIYSNGASDILMFNRIATNITDKGQALQAIKEKSGISTQQAENFEELQLTSEQIGDTWTQYGFPIYKCTASGTTMLLCYTLIPQSSDSQKPADLINVTYTTTTDLFGKSEPAIINLIKLFELVPATTPEQTEPDTNHKLIQAN